jgi:hypothetical protein
MADNVTADAGAGGATFKTDEDTGASAHVPVTKLELGTNGTFDGYAVKGPGTEASNPALLVTLPTDGTGRCDVQGIIAHDASNTADPILLGAHAVDHNHAETTVITGDITHLKSTIDGVLWTIGGSPLQVTETVTVAAADGAQTDTSIIAVSAGQIAVVTRLAISTSAANSVNVDVKVGFSTTTLATPGTAGATDILHEVKGMGADRDIVIGDGSGVLGMGTDDEEIRYSCDAPTSGHITISLSYYLIVS